MKFRLNPVTTGLAILASIIGGYGIYTALHTIYGAPIPIAVLGIALFEGAAVGFATQAIENAKEGDSPMPWIMAMVGVIIVGAIVQFFSTLTEGKGIIVGVVMAMAPVVAIALFIGEVSLYLRKIGRSDGSILDPASRIPRDMKRRFPRAAGIAENMVAINRTLTAQDAIVKALALAPPQLDNTVVVNDRSRKVSRNLATDDIMAQAEKEVLTADAALPDAPTVTPSAASSNGHNPTGKAVRIAARR